MHEVLEVRPVGGYRLWLRFRDGTEGFVDLEPKFDFVGVFTPIVDLDRFAKVRINPDNGSIEWPGEVALDPAVLYSWVKESPGETWLGDDEPEDEDEEEDEGDE